ncbi:S8 family serine peptidase, partial [Candidatus Woesearchaeota archaeon]|nr:S8 family serine peptidase [Candidatus Woesearchaeota archaeon]
ILDRGWPLYLKHGSLNDYLIRISIDKIPTLFEEDVIEKITEKSPPADTTNDGSRQATGVNIIQNSPYNLKGKNIIIGMWDAGQIDNSHDDLPDSRVKIAETYSPSQHATHVAGTMAGSGSLSSANGGSLLQWRGMASSAEVNSYSISDGTEDAPDEHSLAISQRYIDISQNSWGELSLFNFYVPNSQLYDNIVRGLYENKKITIVFAAGNEQDDSPPGYETIRSPGGTAKNTITVGAVNSNNNSMTLFSSWGPVKDGRIKPDIVAPGCKGVHKTSCNSTYNTNSSECIWSTIPTDTYGGDCGTSMAAPVVSGVVALMLEEWKSLFGQNSLPLPSTVKAALIDTAVDLNRDGTGSTIKDGPDYKHGYGLINATGAVQSIVFNNFIESNISSGNSINTILIPSEESELKVTLVWDDKEGSIDSTHHLINDLDLALIGPNGNVYYPWKLNSSNQSQVATRLVNNPVGKDNTNNVEQVAVDNPTSGEWIINVSVNGSITSAPQTYSLVSSFLNTNLPTIGTTTKIIGHGQEWRGFISIANYSGKILDVLLDWAPNNNQLNLSLIGPDGSIYNSSLNGWPQKVSVANPVNGIWALKVVGSDVQKSNFVNFTIETSQLTIPGSPPGGINFTFTKLNYISACNNSNEGLTVVLKGESNSSKPIVDVSNKTNMTSKAFIAGLVIPNHKMLVNLPLGKVDMDYYLARTETGKVMIDADVKLKFSAFNTQASIDEYKSIIQQLYSLYEQSSYVSELKNSGYDGYPQWEAATWISPNSLKAEGEGCKIFLTNTTLKVESKLKWSYSNIDGFNVRQEAKDDVNARFNSWKGNLTQWLNNNAQRAQTSVNSESQYDDLRYVYASVALAQWYKTLDRSQILFGDIIDSNNIYSYDLNISFDKAYWEGKANQRITDNISLNSCFKQGWTSCYAWIFGGVVYINLNTNVTSVLSNETKQVVSDAVSTVYGQKTSENNTFYYANFIEPKKADLKPIAIGFSDIKFYKKRNFNISVAIENKGTVNANNFTINFYYNYTNVDGSYVIYPIGSITNQNVTSGNIVVIKKELNFYTLGTHKIFADVDYNNDVKESNELNNIITKSINVLTTYPTANITSPAHRTAVNSPVTLTGTGFDELDGTLTNTSLNWSSNVDGFLGYGTSLNVNLSTANHVITLTVTNSVGNKAYYSIAISVFPADFPTVKIITPLLNEFFPEGRTVYFEGQSQDKQDGLITGNSLEWNSSIDGFLSYGTTFSNKSLSVGTHTIKFKSTDSDGHVSTTQLNITVLEGTPTATINKPSDKATFFFENSINFSGTASDLQDGDLSIYQWTSSIDGVIGNSKNFLKNLSSGTHTITLTTVDSDGLTDTDSVNIEVFQSGYSLINVISPRNKQILTHGESLQFNSSGQDFNGIIPDSSFNWTSNLNGFLGFGKVFALNTTNLTIGSHNITLKVNNTIGTINIISLNVTILNAPPIISLSSPSPGSIFDEKQLINFTGSGSDLENGTLPNSSLNWTSSLDGFLGSGTFINRTLSKGTHSITLKGTDSLGTNTTVVSNIVVTGLGNITLTILSDGSSQKNLVYNASGSKVVYLRIPRGANITKATFNLTGMSNENP